MTSLLTVTGFNASSQDSQIPPELMSLDLNSTLGATFLGFAVTCAFYGLTTLQTWLYFSHQFADEAMLRGSVLCLWFLDTIHMVFLTITMYQYIVTDFGNFAGILRPIWSLAAMVVVSLVSNTFVRGIFSVRILRLSSGHWVIPVYVINGLSFFAMFDGIYFVAKGLSVPVLFDVHKFSWCFWTGIAADLTADAIVTISQCWLLRNMVTGGGRLVHLQWRWYTRLINYFRRSDSVVLLLMRYSINTGLLTSVCALISLITFTALPGNFIYFGIYFMYSKLYVNSLLATLNARAGAIRDSLERLQEHPLGSMPSMEFKPRDEGLRTGRLTSIIELGSIGIEGQSTTFRESIAEA